MLAPFLKTAFSMKGGEGEVCREWLTTTKKRSKRFSNGWPRMSKGIVGLGGGVAAITRWETVLRAFRSWNSNSAILGGQPCLFHGFSFWRDNNACRDLLFDEKIYSEEYYKIVWREDLKICFSIIFYIRCLKKGKVTRN